MRENSGIVFPNPVPPRPTPTFYTSLQNQSQQTDQEECVDGGDVWLRGKKRERTLPQHTGDAGHKALLSRSGGGGAGL